jgi:hypothetical protein
MPTLNGHNREEAVRAATRAPYRLLEPVAELSCGDADSENLLIQGDNLDALKALPALTGITSLRTSSPGLEAHVSAPMDLVSALNEHS